MIIKGQSRMMFLAAVYVLAKIGEAYLEAAETAILYGSPADAFPLIHTLRKRAVFTLGISTGTFNASEKESAVAHQPKNNEPALSAKVTRLTNNVLAFDKEPKVL